MQRFCLAICLLAISSLICVPASAGVIDSLTSGTSSTTDPDYMGQSFTTPSGGPWNNISFNFFSDSNPATTPYAIGTAYLLGQLFTGTPATLSTAAPGFIATDTSIVGNAYVFDPSVTLQPNTQYFLFGDALFGTASITGGIRHAGSTSYFAATATSSYETSQHVANFALNGSAVPEPGSISLVFLGTIIGSCLLARRKVLE